MKTIAFPLIVAGLLGIEAQDNEPSPNLRRRTQVVSLDPKTVELKSDAAPKSRRKFLSYESSPWEQLWIDHVEKWGQERTICEQLIGNQAPLMHEYMNLTCTARYAPPHDDWCIIDDGFQPMWYNTRVLDEFVVLWENPLEKKRGVKLTTKQQPVVPGRQHEHLVSKFVFLDETTNEQYVEYIEPLVSHLRWPLCKCIPTVPDHPIFKYRGVTFRGWLIPPPPPSKGRIQNAVYFDAGASSWNKGPGGPSLEYFWNMWQRHGIHFHDVFAFEMQTTKEDFYSTLPTSLKDTIHYKQCAVSSDPTKDSEENPFIPQFIKRTAKQDDYVLFKLDIDSPHVENGNIDFILDDPNIHIDELVWEHHIRGNYLMDEWGNPDNPNLDDITIRGSYEYFLRMRQKGIRAHSWI